MDHKVKYGVVFLLIFLLGAPPVMAMDVDRQTWFNSTTDFFATVGKSENDKKEVRRLRRRIRREYRRQKARIKKRSDIQKTIKKQQKEVMEKYNSGTTMIGL